MYAHWPAIAIDSAGTIYVVWDTDNRQPGTSGGCNGAATPAANSIMMISTRDLGATWSAPVTITHPGTRVLWPWIAALTCIVIGSAATVIIRVSRPHSSTAVAVDKRQTWEDLIRDEL